MSRLGTLIVKWCQSNLTELRAKSIKVSLSKTLETPKSFKFKSPSKLTLVCMNKVAGRGLCVCVWHELGKADVALTQRGVRLTSCGRDVDVDADLGDASSLQRGHTSVRAEVGELEVYDVQVGGPRWDVGVRLGDDHTLWAPQGTAILQPAKRQLLWRRRLHLGHPNLCYMYCTKKDEKYECPSITIPDKISWLHVRSGCCRRCGRGREWSRIAPSSKLWRENSFN